MPVQTPPDSRSRYRRDDYGKCLCVSFPGHELDLIEDLDVLAHLELCNSRSQYIRKLIRRERMKYKEQQQQLTDWNSVWGEK